MPELFMNVAQFLDRDEQKDLLRFLTAGSVDDSKSTLINHWQKAFPGNSRPSLPGLVPTARCHRPFCQGGAGKSSFCSGHRYPLRRTADPGFNHPDGNDEHSNGSGANHQAASREKIYRFQLNNVVTVFSASRFPIPNFQGALKGDYQNAGHKKNC